LAGQLAHASSADPDLFMPLHSITIILQHAGHERLHKPAEHFKHVKINLHEKIVIVTASSP
jgi:hypothetical protein